MNDACGEPVGIADRDKQKITSGIEEQGQRRQPPRHRRQTGSRPAKAIVQAAEQIGKNGDIFQKEHDDFLRANFFPAQQPPGEELGITFIKIGAKEKQDGEVHGHKRPALPEFQRAGDEQKNHQRDLLDQTPADQSRQEIFGWRIFQSPKIAIFGDALPAASTRARYRSLVYLNSNRLFRRIGWYIFFCSAFGWPFMAASTSSSIFYRLRRKNICGAVDGRMKTF